jgi:hypothetical protein
MSLNRHMGLFVVQRNSGAPTHDAFPHMRGPLATKLEDLQQGLR